MWRYIVLNLCFVILVITLLTLQHSSSVFGPTAHSSAVTDSDTSQTFELAPDAESPGNLRAPADFNRAVAYLYDMWRRGMVLKEWTIEYNAFRWEILRASSPAESDLLDARFHVANAEVFTEAMSKKTRAIRELDRAETSLKAAEALVEPSFARQVKTIDDEITAAETREQTEDTSSTMPFETIKAHLDHLIAMVRSAKMSGQPPYFRSRLKLDICHQSMDTMNSAARSMTTRQIDMSYRVAAGVSRRICPLPESVSR